MRNVAWLNGIRKAFDLTCETVKVVEDDQHIIVNRFINGDKNDYTGWDIEDVINNLNENGYFITSVEKDGDVRIYYLTNLTIFSD
ncbi:hypothetical protein [Metabacillus arenae]|uniref:Uncharacterized protein n=1 Tax=Metabacillus arenae TaxID=2771434 RepID=A0A926RWF2_9BACI|nr:hypothetical protein [Metabacillus arenae]MBD1379112.1 hypothetical protein [Metabacillus arenae]